MTRFEPSFSEIREVEKEMKFKKCNGFKGKKGQEFNDILPDNDYISQVVTISKYRRGSHLAMKGAKRRESKFQNLLLPLHADNLPDRNCAKCSAYCFDYILWLRLQNCLYKIVRDPLFELLITVFIVVNTMFLAVEHHGMSDDLKRILDVGNKVSGILVVATLAENYKGF